MISPPPAQSSPSQEAPATERKYVGSTPARKRIGQTPAALLIKAIFRPLFKGLYYTMRWVGSHKLVSLLALLLLVGSIFVTSILSTGKTPLGNGSDVVKQAANSHPNLSPYVQNWLVALRDGDINNLEQLEKNLSQSAPPPNTASWVLEFSQSRAQTSWQSVNVISITNGPDKAVDTFVEVQLQLSQNAGGNKALAIYHFVTDPLSGRIIFIDLVQARAIA
jgi:hypothetical protein